MKPIEELVRPNIWSLKKYNSARGNLDCSKTRVYLDANENPYNNPMNRYPDILQRDLKVRIAELKNVNADNMFLGNGTDEAVDLIYRIFCRPGKDNVVAIEPTYVKYGEYAEINDVEYRKVQLSDDYMLNAEALLNACDNNTKVIWICTPNNPTGNDMDRAELKRVLTEFQGVVVVDEAYGDFSDLTPIRSYMGYFPNMIVLNTFSTSWANASLRLGMAFAGEEIIALFNKVRSLYNVSRLTQQAGLEILDSMDKVERWMTFIRKEREFMIPCLRELPLVEKVFPTSANFVLIKVKNSTDVYNKLLKKGILVKNCNDIPLCKDCLRITIGTKDENSELLGALRSM